MQKYYRMYVKFRKDEFDALIEYADEHARDKQNQVRWIVRQELIRSEYLEDLPWELVDNARHTES